MHKSGQSRARAGAIVLNVFGVAAIALMAARYVQLHGEFAAADHSLAETRSHAALAISNRLALPPNRRLAVCNEGDTDATISALTSNYIDGKGKPVTYNSASGEGHTWKIAAGSRLILEDVEAGAPVWDGSAIFYAIDVVSAGKSRLLAGTSEDLKSGCIQLATGKPADRD
jgi:hypothetical protein